MAKITIDSPTPNLREFEFASAILAALGKLAEKTELIRIAEGECSDPEVSAITIVVNLGLKKVETKTSSPHYFYPDTRNGAAKSLADTVRQRAFDELGEIEHQVRIARQMLQEWPK